MVVNRYMTAYVDYDRDGDCWTREFDNNSDELEWHRDRNDRLIEVIEGTDWMLQFDNDLPFIINKTNIIFIPKETFHRLHSGTDKLVLKIREYRDDERP